MGRRSRAKRQAREEKEDEFRQKSRRFEQEYEWQYEQYNQNYNRQRYYYYYYYEEEEEKENYSNHKQQNSYSAQRSNPCKKDYYTILGVERHATLVLIKKAYKQKALIYHPGKPLFKIEILI